MKTTVTTSETTGVWCAERGHPWLTYNPWLNRTWCRCGERQADGEQPHDWDADWELFHDHPRDTACSCYVKPRPAAAATPELVPAGPVVQASLFDEEPAA